MKLFSKEEKENVLKKFNSKSGVFTRLYNQDEEYKNPYGMLYRYPSYEDADVVVVLKYIRSKNNKFEKDAFENSHLISMQKVMNIGDRFIRWCKNTNKNYKDYLFKNIAQNKHCFSLWDDQILNQKPSAYDLKFFERIKKYYKKDMNILYFTYKEEEN